MFFGRKTPDAARQKALRSVAPSPLRDYLEAPLPDANTPIQDLRLLAVDIETTGLHPRNDHVLSVGFVPVDGLTIDVEGLDAIDGTPVVDIKPVLKGFLPRGEVREPAWAAELMEGYW